MVSLTVEAHRLVLDNTKLGIADVFYDLKRQQGKLLEKRTLKTMKNGDNVCGGKIPEL